MQNRSDSRLKDRAESGFLKPSHRRFVISTWSPNTMLCAYASGKAGRCGWRSPVPPVSKPRLGTSDRGNASGRCGAAASDDAPDTGGEYCAAVRIGVGIGYVLLENNITLSTARSGRAGSDHQDPPAALLLHCRTAHPLGAPPPLCICHNVGPGKPSSVTPWHDCAPCHFRPDGSPSATDPPSGQLNVPANSVREGHFLPTACRIPPTMAIAGRHHRVWVATHAALIPTYWNRAWPVRLPLPINPCVNVSAHPYGGLGIRKGSCPPKPAKRRSKVPRRLPVLSNRIQSRSAFWAAIAVVPVPA